MRRRFTFFLVTILLSPHLKAQFDSVNLDFNNVGTQLTNNGIFFNDVNLNKAAYEIPKGSENSGIYSMSFWCGGRDVSGQLKLAAQDYADEYDFFAGALGSGAAAEAPVPAQADGVYTVSRSTIDLHIANWATPGYVVPEELLEWPAHGDTGLGMDYYLAPFVDANGNGTYEPALGDYPKIRGDNAVYLIMNDKEDVHASGGDPIGVEVHFMFYQYASDDFLNNTTFLNIKLINRGTQTIYDFLTGIRVDFDLGNPTDDFIGCDTTSNLGFVYNSSNFDSGVGGSPGYGENVPSFGVMALNENLHTFAEQRSSMGALTATGRYNLMNGIWPDGSNFTEGGTGHGGVTPTRFLYSGNPTVEGSWSENQAGLTSGDRKALISVHEPVLSPFEILCYDFAFVYARTGNNLENVNALIDVAEEVKTFYDEQTSFDCKRGFVSTATAKDLNTFTIYPNPSKGQINIKGEGEYAVKIYTTDGRLVYQKADLNGVVNLNPQLAEGSYLVEIIQAENNHFSRLIIE